MILINVIIIAFKCNYCDGGGFPGIMDVCSKDMIRNNICVEKRKWCFADDCQKRK
jgi:hypothetical protein